MKYLIILISLILVSCLTKKYGKYNLQQVNNEVFYLKQEGRKENVDTLIRPKSLDDKYKVYVVDEEVLTVYWVKLELFNKEKNIYVLNVYFTDIYGVGHFSNDTYYVPFKSEMYDLKNWDNTIVDVNGIFSKFMSISVDNNIYWFIAIDDPTKAKDFGIYKNRKKYSVNGINSKIDLNNKINCESFLCDIFIEKVDTNLFNIEIVLDNKREIKGKYVLKNPSNNKVDNFDYRRFKYFEVDTDKIYFVGNECYLERKLDVSK